MNTTSSFSPPLLRGGTSQWLSSPACSSYQSQSILSRGTIILLSLNVGVNLHNGSKKFSIPPPRLSSINFDNEVAIVPLLCYRSNFILHLVYRILYSDSITNM